MPPFWESAQQYAVLSLLADRIHDDSGRCFLSQATIAARLRLSARQVSRIVCELEATGRVFVERRSGRQGAHTYSLDLSPIADASVRACDCPSADTGVHTTRDRFGRFATESADTPGNSADVDDEPVRTPASAEPIPEPDQPKAAAKPQPILGRVALNHPPTDAARQPSDSGNYRVLLRLAYEQLDADHSLSGGSLVEAVKDRAASLRIDYGRHPDVARDVVHRACASAEAGRRLFSDRTEGPSVRVGVA